MWVQSLGQEDPLKKEMATCPNLLAWKIPWTEESVGYHPSGCKDLATTGHTQMHALSCRLVEEET